MNARKISIAVSLVDGKPCLELVPKKQVKMDCSNLVSDEFDALVAHGFYGITPSLSMQAIDTIVSVRYVLMDIKAGFSLYEIDKERLEKLFTLLWGYLLHYPGDQMSKELWEKCELVLCEPE